MCRLKRVEFHWVRNSRVQTWENRHIDMHWVGDSLKCRLGRIDLLLVGERKTIRGVKI